MFTDLVLKKDEKRGKEPTILDQRIGTPHMRK